MQDLAQDLFNTIATKLHIGPYTSRSLTALCCSHRYLEAKTNQYWRHKCMADLGATGAGQDDPTIPWRNFYNTKLNSYFACRVGEWTVSHVRTYLCNFGAQEYNNDYVTPYLLESADKYYTHLSSLGHTSDDVELLDMIPVEHAPKKNARSIVSLLVEELGCAMPGEVILNSLALIKYYLDKVDCRVLYNDVYIEGENKIVPYKWPTRTNFITRILDSKEDPVKVKYVLHHPKTLWARKLGNWLVANCSYASHLKVIQSLKGITFTDQSENRGWRPYCCLISMGKLDCLDLMLKDKRISLNGIVGDCIFAQNGSEAAVQHVLKHPRVQAEARKVKTIPMYQRKKLICGSRSKALADMIVALYPALMQCREFADGYERLI